jgi:RNA polymerase sigma factor (TIGR02999 family)
MSTEVLIPEHPYQPAQSTDMLFSTLYAELHRMAKIELARQIAPATVGVTTLLHEAYVTLAGRTEVNFPDHARFLGYVARVMRGLIIDHARNRTAFKRGGAFEITSLTTQLCEHPADPKQLGVLSDVLDHLATIEPDLAEVVDLRFFCGLSLSEIAVLQAVAERTVQRRWKKARLYLHNQLHESCPL